MWDVFLFDPDFKIERPKRYYRQGLNNILHNELAMIEHHFSSPVKPQPVENPALEQQPSQHLQLPRKRRDSDGHSLLGSIKSRISRIFHLDSDTPHRGGYDPRCEGRRSQGNEHADDSDSSGSVSLPPRTRTPMLDPSTNLNPMAVSENHQDPNVESQQAGQAAKKKKKTEDVSKHTFYIVNSQMRLKLFARSEVCILSGLTYPLLN